MAQDIDKPLNMAIDDCIEKELFLIIWNKNMKVLSKC